MRLPLLVATAALLALAIACGGDNTTPTPTPSPIPTPSPTPSPTPTYNPTPTSSIDVTNVCGVNPSPATSAQVVVDAPGPSDHITSPVTVSGQIAAFEGTFQISIKDSGGNDLATQQGHSAEGQALSAFSESVPFTVSQEMPACVWVFQYSAEDGSPITVHQIPVILQPASPGTNVCTTNPDPATADEVQVTSPAPGDHVTSPFQVTGLVNAFEAQFNIAIKNAAGDDIATQSAHSQEGQTLAPFSATVSFVVTAPAQACLWVYDVSNADGVTPTNVLQVPIVLEP